MTFCTRRPKLWAMHFDVGEPGGWVGVSSSGHAQEARGRSPPFAQALGGTLGLRTRHIPRQSGDLDVVSRRPAHAQSAGIWLGLARVPNAFGARQLDVGNCMQDQGRVPAVKNVCFF